MKNKKISLILAIAFGIIVGLIYTNKFFSDLGTFMFSFSSVLTVIFVVLYFVKGERVFGVWRNFAVIYILVAFILALIAPSAPGFIRPDSEMITLWLAAIFFIISLVIIIKKREKHSPLDLHDC